MTTPTPRPASTFRQQKRERLDRYFQQINDIILARQDPITGLLPASTAVTAHGDYTDAWVRDNVYSILAVWGLALAYRRLDSEEDRTYLLEQSVVKLMRGLLTAMMKQADKVERFKLTSDPNHALHAKYGTRTGEVVVGDSAWGHLQLDATSLYLLMLAQMTASGLRIVFTLDEVDFVQNLVHYIGRAYRTPDYGIWERGNKINRGIPELNASSIGMAKAALEALSEFDLFGARNGRGSVIHVIPDEIARTRITLESLLPRESASKEVDAATLSVVGFPAFAVEDRELVARTRRTVTEKLEGRYGCKRFLLDGHQTALEDPTRLAYEATELKQFQDIECEWPLFFAYLLLDALFAGDLETAQRYRSRLDDLQVERNGQHLLPELYYVPAQRIAAEKANPHSQLREPNENVPLVWAQSLYWLGALIQDGLMHVADIDPLGRRLRPGRQPQRTVQVALLAENGDVQERLEALGIVTETLEQIAPFQVRQADELAAALANVGRNPKLGLTGRPLRRLRTLTTSRIYEFGDERILFLPQVLNRQDFYLTLDGRMLVEQLRMVMVYVHRHWDLPGKPLITLLLSASMLEEAGGEVLLQFIEDLRGGECNGVPVRVGRLAQLMPTAGRARLDDVDGIRFATPGLQGAQEPECVLRFDAAATRPLDRSALNRWGPEVPQATLLRVLGQSSNLYEQFELLRILRNRYGSDFATGLRRRDGTVCRVTDLLEEVYGRACERRCWGVVRGAAGVLGKFPERLVDAVAEIVVRQKQLTVGHAYSAKATIRQPLDREAILHLIRTFGGEDPKEHVLIQELIVDLGLLVVAHPELFTDLLTLRVGHLLRLLISEAAREQGLDPAEAFECLAGLSPSSVAERLRQVLTRFQQAEDALGRMDFLHRDGASGRLERIRFEASTNPTDLGPAEDWLQWRQRHGAFSRMPDRFFGGVWQLLRHCRGVVIGDRYNRKRRLDSEILLSETTSGEKSFALRVEHLLNKIQTPEYRQLTKEALSAVSTFAEANPSFRVEEDLIMDALIGHAVRLSWLAVHPGQTAAHYEAHKPEAWVDFYRKPPHEAANAFLEALDYLLNPTPNPT